MGLKDFIKDIKTVDKGKSLVSMGVDFGSSSIKMVVLEEVQGKITLKNYGEIALGPYANKPAGMVVSLPPDTLAKAFADLVEKAAANAGSVATSVPLSSSLIVPLTLPAGAEGNLSSIVPNEVRQYIPVPVENVYLDWQQIPNTEKPTKTEEEKEEGGEVVKPKAPDINLLVFVINKDLINSYRETLSVVGLQPEYYELETFSVLRSSLEPGTDEAVVIDLGAKYLKIYVVKEAKVVALEKIMLGGGVFTQEISDRLKVDYKKAEDLKKKLKLSEIPSEPLRKSIVGHVDRIVRAVKRLVKEHELKKDTQVYLSGGGILLYGLPEYMATQLGRQVVVSQPFINISAPAYLNDLLAETGPEYTVATGLALRHLRNH